MTGPSSTAPTAANGSAGSRITKKEVPVIMQIVTILLSTHGSVRWKWLALYLFWIVVLTFAVYLAVTP